MLLCLSLSIMKLILLTAVSYTSPDGNENITAFLFLKKIGRKCAGKDEQICSLTH